MIEVQTFDDVDVGHILDNLDAFSDEEILEIDRMVDELHNRKAN